MTTTKKDFLLLLLRNNKKRTLFDLGDRPGTITIRFNFQVNNSLAHKIPIFRLCNNRLWTWTHARTTNFCHVCKFIRNFKNFPRFVYTFTVVEFWLSSVHTHRSQLILICQLDGGSHWNVYTNVYFNFNK